MSECRRKIEREFDRAKVWLGEVKLRLRAEEVEAIHKRYKLSSGRMRRRKKFTHFKYTVAREEIFTFRR